MRTSRDSLYKFTPGKYRIIKLGRRYASSFGGQLNVRKYENKEFVNFIEVHPPGSTDLNSDFCVFIDEDRRSWVVTEHQNNMNRIDHILERTVCTQSKQN